MLATILAGIAAFERELIQERIRSGMAAAKARGKRFGRQLGQRPSDRLAPRVLALVAQGRSYRLIGRELGLSKNTVADIVKRTRAASAASGDAKVPGASRLGVTTRKCVLCPADMYNQRTSVRLFVRQSPSPDRRCV